MINDRQENNRKILSMISDVVEKHPELRFCQILSILNLPYFTEDGEDTFYEESYTTLKRIDSIHKNFDELCK